MKRIQKKWRQGSLTIEAVFITGMFLWISFVILALMFYAHDRAFYTACACEKAQKESSLALWQGTSDVVKEEAQALAKERRVPGTAPQFFWQNGKTQTEVGYSGKTQVAFGTEARSYESRAVSRKICPTEQIRKMRRLRQIADEAGGEQTWK